MCTDGVGWGEKVVHELRDLTGSLTLEGPACHCRSFRVCSAWGEARAGAGAMIRKVCYTQTVIP